jgi:BASS family bile acid:Na+ symporter
VKDFLGRLMELSVLAFAVTSMLSVGLAYSVRQIIGPLRRAHAVIRACLANFILVPLLAYIVTQLIPGLEHPMKIGLFLIATAAGAPFLIKLVQVANGDVALSAALLVLLLAVTIVYMPIVVPLLLPGAEVSALAIATPLALTMLFPLAIGHFVKAKVPDWANRLQPIARKLSTIALVLLLLSTLLANLDAIIGMLGEGAILAALLVIGGAYFIGYFLATTAPARTVLSLGTAQRNIAAATVVASRGFDDPNVVVMVVVASLVGMILLFPIAWMLRRRAAKHAEAEPRPREA